MNLTNDYYEYEQGQNEIIVKGRLKNNIHYWKTVLKANSFVIDTIENGYKIPFFSKPPESFSPNNRSALVDPDFVNEAVSSLLYRGLIQKCKEAPHVVNPLTVSNQKIGKKRLILDLRLVNKHLWKQSIKYEDIRIALMYLESESWMIKFDIHSAYHFIDVYIPHTTFLGFSWPDKDGTLCYYTFLVLPFGIRTAPYLFTKVTRRLVKKWRGEGKKVVMYLDDGFGCAKGKTNTQCVSEEIKTDLLLSGFVPKVGESQWEPVQELTWLGTDINSLKCSISIPSSRTERLKQSVNEILSKQGRHVHIKAVASVVGQLISMGIVIGSVCQIMTRFLSIDNLKARSWNSYIKLCDSSIDQLYFWKYNLASKYCRNVVEAYKTSKIVFSDASSIGYGSYEVNTVNGIVHDMWTKEESLRSSTWRELCAVMRTLKAIKHILANQRVKWFTDNKNDCSIVKKGSMKRDLQELSLDIFQFCSNHSISIEIEWICRDSNTKADMISNFIDIDDWGISFELLYLLQDRWGKLEVDWFASSYNAKLPVFFSRFWNEGSTGVDAYTEKWGEAFGLFVPPVNLVPRVLKQIQEQRARGVLVIPFWPSAAFWPLLCVGQGGFTRQITDWMDLPISKELYTPSTCGRGCFGTEDLCFRMIALKVNYRDL